MGWGSESIGAGRWRRVLGYGEFEGRGEGVREIEIEIEEEEEVARRE